MPNQRPQYDVHLSRHDSRASRPRDPTREELQRISERLGSDLKTTLQEMMDDNAISFKERVTGTGQCLVNAPGSVHQSFTTEDHGIVSEKVSEVDNNSSNGCLLWALGPNVHVHFPSKKDG